MQVYHACASRADQVPGTVYRQVRVFSLANTRPSVQTSWPLADDARTSLYHTPEGQVKTFAQITISNP